MCKELCWHHSDYHWSRGQCRRHCGGIAGKGGAGVPQAACWTSCALQPCQQHVCRAWVWAHSPCRRCGPQPRQTTRFSCVRGCSIVPSGRTLWPPVTELTRPFKSSASLPASWSWGRAAAACISLRRAWTLSAKTTGGLEWNMLLHCSAVTSLTRSSGASFYITLVTVALVFIHNKLILIDCQLLGLHRGEAMQPALAAW